jgi:hypothetical protein
VNSAYEARKIRTVAAAVVVAGRTSMDALALIFALVAQLEERLPCKQRILKAQDGVEEPG